MPRVLIALDVTEADAADPADLLASVAARLEDEAGYLAPDDRPIQPVRVVLALSTDETPLDAQQLVEAYEIGTAGGP